MDKESKSEECTMVSIIMPVYNAAEFLNDSVGDILAQTYEDFELICVYDDATTDGSEIILEKKSCEDTRIRIIHNDVVGSNAARNKGLDEASGKYLLFLDADDRFESSMLDQIVRVAEESACDVLAFDGDVFDNVSGVHKSAPWLLKGMCDVPDKDPFDVLNTTIWNKLYLREHIITNNLRFNNPEKGFPTSFVFLAVVYAKKIEVLRQVLVHYRVNNSSSLIANTDKDALGAFNEYVAIKDRLDSDGRFEEKRIIFIKQARAYLFQRLHLLKTPDGFSELYNAMHNGGIEKLELTGRYPGEHVDPVMEGVFQEIREKDIDEYLYDNMRILRNAGLLSVESRILSLEKYPDARRIAIYGGGDVGKDFFMQVMRRRGLTLSCWVDRNWEKIGYPLQSPEILKEKDYDIVLIAVADKRIADSIRGSLIDMGIPEDKIVWNEYTQII